LATRGETNKMAEAMFIGSPTDTGAIAADSANSWGSMFARAQAVAQSKAQFPLLQSQLAGQIAIQQQSRELSNIEIQKQQGLLALAPSINAASKAQADATIATSGAQIATAHASAAMTAAAAADFPNVLGAFNSVTGAGPSTAPVDPNAPVAAPAPVPAADAVTAARSSQGLPPSSPASAQTPVAPPGINYASIVKAQTAYNIYKARYGDLPGARPMLASLDAKMTALNAAYSMTLAQNIPAHEAAIKAATALAVTNPTAGLQALQDVGSDEDFNHADAAFPNANLEGQYKNAFTTVSGYVTKQQEANNQAAEQSRTAQAQKDQQTRQIAADQAKVQLQRTQENTIDPSLGYTGVAPTSAAAEDFRTTAAEANDSSEKLGRLIAISGIPEKSLTPELRGEATVLATELQGDLKGPLFGGRLSNTDIGLLDKVIANPTDLFSLDSSNKKKLQTLQTGVQRVVSLKAAALGLRPATQTSSGPVTVGGTPSSSAPATFSYTSP
jgi:hypothetical protein